MQQWKRIGLTEEQIQVLYREWGVFYSNKQKLDIAAQCYDQSLELQTDDPKALYYRSRCKRSIARTAEALNDAKTALASAPHSQPYALEVCDGLYELNDLERAKCAISNNSSKFTGHKLEAFEYRSDALLENFDASIGDTLSPFILQKKKYFYLAFDKLYKELNADKRPLWKILKEQEKCDVLSVPEEEEEFICPREVARRKRSFNVFNQIYMRRSWTDVLFLKALKTDPNLLLPQSQWTRPQLEHWVNTKYDVTMKFLKMLHARSPLYTENVRKCPNEKLAEQMKQNYLYRVQYQVHRNMLSILRQIRFLRKTRQIQKLNNYVEEVMGDYVVLKTNRVMPWKFEFINEVYNLLALTYIDEYVDTPANIFSHPPEERLHLLLRMPREKDKEPTPFVFGDRSTYHDEFAADVSMIRHKAILTRMETRMRFSKYPIEKAYIWHEIANSHLRNYRLDECVTISNKSVDEAQNGNSYVWMLLGLLTICKSHAHMNKIEQLRLTLEMLTKIAKALKSEKLQNFVQLAVKINYDNFDIKKQSENLRQQKSKQSRVSLE